MEQGFSCTSLVTPLPMDSDLLGCPCFESASWMLTLVFLSTANEYFSVDRKHRSRPACYSESFGFVLAVTQNSAQVSRFSQFQTNNVCHKIPELTIHILGQIDGLVILITILIDVLTSNTFQISINISNHA